jgi:hypothetical protein
MARYVRQAFGFDLGGVDNRGAGGGPMKHNPEPATFTDYVLCALLMAALGLGLAWAF